MSNQASNELLNRLTEFERLLWKAKVSAVLTQEEWWELVDGCRRLRESLETLQD